MFRAQNGVLGFWGFVWLAGLCLFCFLPLWELLLFSVCSVLLCIVVCFVCYFVLFSVSMAKVVSSMASMMYDGSTDPKEFSRQFRLHALFNDWDEAKQLTSLPLFLKGKAERVYNAITVKSKIDDVLKEINKKCAQPQEALLHQFYGRRREPHESITKYALALQDMLVLAVPDMDAAQQAVLLRAQLCLSLPEHMRALIQFNASLAWDDLLACLDKSMPHVNAHALQSAASDQYIGQASYAKAPLVKTEPLELNWSDSRNTGRNAQHGQSHRGNQAQHDRQPQSQAQSSRFNGTCNICSIYGHKASQCRRRFRENNGGGSAHNSSNSSQNSSAHYGNGQGRGSRNQGSPNRNGANVAA